jgi:ribonuclease E
MSKLMLIDAVHPEETRVALVSEGQVDDFDFETAGKRQLRGNIYLAKVTRVEPSLQAAFVEYGGNRHGFLAFSEIHPDYYQLPQADREALLAEEAAQTSDDEEDDEDDADSDDAENGNGDDEAPRRKRQSITRRYKIQEVIRRRQIMLVQVVKEERGTKGAALTTYLSLAGRYGVLMPNTPRGGGISRKITSAPDRKRLKEIVQELDVPRGMGLIVRTAGAKRTKTEVRRDCDYLLKLWGKIREATMTSIAPCLIHEEGNLVQRAMRDLFEKDIEEVLVQGDEAYRQAKELAKLLMPSQARKVKHYKEPTPLFVDQGVDDQLDNIFSPTVKLKSGGYLVINQTEALVAIDVNSGKSTRERNIEQTALRTNQEAAEEACRQMRLRDLAGLIVIDFIDMDESKNVRAIEKKMKDCLKADRARVQNNRISMFGLMEISRQRRRTGVLQATSDPCEVCDGTGRVRSVESAALQLLRALEGRLAFGKFNQVTAEAPTDVALYLLNNKRLVLADLEEKAGTPIAITSSTEMRAGDFTIDADRIPGSGEAEEKEAKRRQKEARRQAKKEASEMEVIELEEETADANAEANAGETDVSSETKDDEEGDDRNKRRRRGRRGGRRRRSRETTEAETPEDAEARSGDAPSETAPVEVAVDVSTIEPATPSEPAPEDGGQLLDGISTSASELLDGIETEERSASSSRRRRRGGRGRSRRSRERSEDTTEVKASETEESEDARDGDTGDAPETPTEPVAETKPQETEPAMSEEADAAPVEAEAAATKAAEPEATEPVSLSVVEAETAAPQESESSDAPEPEAPEPEKPAEPAKAEDTEKGRPRRRGWWQRKASG